MEDSNKRLTLWGKEVWWEAMGSCRHYLRVAYSHASCVEHTLTPQTLKTMLKGAQVVGALGNTFYIGFDSAVDMTLSQRICLNTGYLTARIIDPFALICSGIKGLSPADLYKRFSVYGPLLCVCEHVHVIRRNRWAFINFKNRGDAFKALVMTSMESDINTRTKVLGAWQPYPPKSYSPARMQGVQVYCP